MHNQISQRLLNSIVINAQTLWGLKWSLLVSIHGLNEMLVNLCPNPCKRKIIAIISGTCTSYILRPPAATCTMHTSLMNLHTCTCRLTWKKKILMYLCKYQSFFKLILVIIWSSLSMITCITMVLHYNYKSVEKLKKGSSILSWTYMYTLARFVNVEVT